MPRWTIVPLLRAQSVAEHSWAVAILAMELAKRCGVTPDDVARMAVEHDQSEVVTGDIPTPLKKAIVAAGAGHVVHHSPIDNDNMIETIVKLADTMEALIYVQKWGHTKQTAQIAEEMYNRLEDETAKYDSVYKHVMDILREALDD